MGEQFACRLSHLLAARYYVRLDLFHIHGPVEAGMDMIFGCFQLGRDWFKKCVTPCGTGQRGRNMSRIPGPRPSDFAS